MAKRKLELQPSEIVEAHDSVTVHGIVAEVSPVKSGKKAPYSKYYTPVNLLMEKTQCD